MIQCIAAIHGSTRVGDQPGSSSWADAGAVRLLVGPDPDDAAVKRALFWVFVSPISSSSDCTMVIMYSRPGSARRMVFKGLKPRLLFQFHGFRRGQVDNSADCIAIKVDGSSGSGALT